MSAKRIARLKAAVLMCVLAGGLTGCQDPREVTMHSPGDYKGKADPLLALEETPEYDQRLAQRFENQRDR